MSSALDSTARSPSPAVPAVPAAGRPLGVLHLLAPGAVGGLESVVRALASGQHAAGHRVVVGAVLARTDHAAPFLNALRADGVDVRRVVARGRDYLGERRQVTALCERLRPDVVHTHGYRSDVVDAGAARALGIATVTTVHGFTGGGLNRVYEWLQVRAFRKFSAVVAVSAPLVARLRAAGVPAARVHLLPNAYAARAAPLPRAEARGALGLPAGAWVVGWVGRMSPEKGADVLLDAVARMAGGPIVSLIGDGPQRAALERRARSLGIAERVRFHGMVPEAGRLYTAFDAFALSSRTEGTPISLLEAMAAGTPVVATSVGGVPDVVTPAEARLVPSDSPLALAAALDDVRGDPAAAASRALAALGRLRDRFDARGWLARYESLYRSLLVSRSDSSHA